MALHWKVMKVIWLGQCLQMKDDHQSTPLVIQMEVLLVIQYVQMHSPVVVTPPPLPFEDLLLLVHQGHEALNLMHVHDSAQPFDGKNNVLSIRCKYTE